MAAPGGGLGLAAESDSKRIVAMSWNLGAAASSYLSFLLAQEPRVLGALSLLLPILARDFFVLNVFVNIHKPPAHPAHGVQMVEMQMQPSEETIAACVAACSKSGDPATAVARCWDWWRWVSCGFFFWQPEAW